MDSFASFISRCFNTDAAYTRQILRYSAYSFGLVIYTQFIYLIGYEMGKLEDKTDIKKPDFTKKDREIEKDSEL